MQDFTIVTDNIFMCDIDDYVYCGSLPELKFTESIIQRFFVSFLQKENNSKNKLFIRALRNNSIKHIIGDFL